jgi:hypothetical protein
LFCFTRSLIPHPRLFPAPLNPNKVVASLRFFVRGQPPLIVVLACGSLGLIGLSRFLQCFVSFFCPALFYGCGRVHSAIAPVTPPRFFYPARVAGLSVWTVPLRSTSINTSNPPHLPCPQKNFTARQKSRPALP